MDISAGGCFPHPNTGQKFYFRMYHLKRKQKNSISDDRTFGGIKERNKYGTETGQFSNVLLENKVK